MKDLSFKSLHTFKNVYINKGGSYIIGDIYDLGDISESGDQDVVENDLRCLECKSIRGNNDEYCNCEEYIYGEYDLLYRLRYTGVKDIKDKMIFEGDIVQSKKKGRRNFFGPVVFISGEFKFRMLGIDGEYIYNKLINVEIVGDIFVNDDYLNT